MKVIALLPMKGHSSRVPGKNFRSMVGKPLFRWILDELMATDFISEVIINTDAKELLERTDLPEGHVHVRIRDRAAALCGDAVSMNRIIEDDLADSDADAYLMTHTTNPAMTARTFCTAFDAYKHGLSAGHDSLFSVTRFQARFYRADGSTVNHDPNSLIPTQELEPWYEENSCLYFFSKESFAATGARIGRTPILFETSKTESVDIDEPDDWLLAEALLEARTRR